MVSGRSIFALAALWCVHATAHAQDDEAEGRRLLELAVHARDEGRLEEARELLVRSLEEHRWSYPAFELGNVLAAMGRPVEAVAIYEELLAGGYGEVTGEARTNIETALATARPRIARIALSWRGAADAIVRLDGAIVPNEENATELALAVDPGRHIVAIEAGAVRTERTVSVSAGETAPLAIDLAPRGRLRVESDPEARIEVGDLGSRVGVFDLEVPAGRYDVVVTLDDETLEESVVVTPGESTSVHLAPEVGGISPWLWIVLSAVAVGAGAAVLAIILATGGPPTDDIGT
jgi:hypothetical protein